MSTLAELEQSVFQRGLILTGDASGAAHVTRAILARYDDLRRVGESALLRAIVQDARAWPREFDPATPSAVSPWEPPTAPERQLFHAVAALPVQQREAWTLTRLEQLGDVEASRAMDCSRTALREVHLAGADHALRPLLGDAYEPAIEALRKSLAAVNPADALSDVRVRLRAVVLRKRLVRLLMFLLFLAACATLWWVMTDLHHANEREVEQRRLYEAEQEKFSVPMTPEENAQ